MSSYGLTSTVFRKGRSCLTQLLHHVDDILDNFTMNQDTDSIFLDFAKAFDEVDHDLLLKKLQRYDFQGRLLNWIEAFLASQAGNNVLLSMVNFHPLHGSSVELPGHSAWANIVFDIY